MESSQLLHRHWVLPKQTREGLGWSPGFGMVRPFEEEGSIRVCAAAGGLVWVEVEGKGLFVGNLVTNGWKQIPGRAPNSGVDVGMVVAEGGEYYLACKALNDPLVFHLYDSTAGCWLEMVYDWETPGNTCYNICDCLDLQGCFIVPHSRRNRAAVYNPKGNCWCQITLPGRFSPHREIFWYEKRLIYASVVKLEGGRHEVVVRSLELESAYASLDQWRVISRADLGSNVDTVCLRGGERYISVVVERTTGPEPSALAFDLEQKSWHHLAADEDLLCQVAALPA